MSGSALISCPFDDVLSRTIGRGDRFDDVQRRGASGRAAWR